MPRAILHMVHNGEPIAWLGVVVAVHLNTRGQVSHS